nr:PREDICTED: protein FAM13A-like [Latimeria chalumnae]|eukprot:XP_014349424.1 PREDICTED: protein FAM13A-like [Latimeria chalumnae]
MAKLLENYTAFFEAKEKKAAEEQVKIITVKEASLEAAQTAALPNGSVPAVPKSRRPRKKAAKLKSEDYVKSFSLLQPGQSSGTPQVSLRLIDRAASLEDMDLSEEITRPGNSAESLSSSQDEERPMSPFYLR